MSEHKQDRGIKVTMIREVAVSTYSGDRSVMEHQVVGAHIIFETEDGLEPKVKNPSFSDVGEWKVIRP